MRPIWTSSSSYEIRILLYSKEQDFFVLYRFGQRFKRLTHDSSTLILIVALKLKFTEAL